MTKLKTLKDLNEQFRKDNIPQRLSGDEFNDFWEEILKVDAVKWIKAGTINKAVWRCFFNITEEELAK